MTPAVTISAVLPGRQHVRSRRAARARLSDRPASSIGAPNGAAPPCMAEALDDRGVSLRVSTNRQALTVSCTCLSEDFDDVLAIVADVARSPTFPGGGDREAPVRSASRSSGRTKTTRGARAVDGGPRAALHRQHPYGRPSKGTAVGVERVTRADMVAFHAQRIRPGALSLAIVGDIAPRARARPRRRGARRLDGARRPPRRPLPPPPPARDAGSG